MPFDPEQLKLEREERCLAFCGVLREAHLVPADVSVPLARGAPPASRSPIAAADARSFVGVIPVPPECARLICDFAFGSPTDYVNSRFEECVEEQRQRYSRSQGKIVLRSKARVGERVRYSRWICDHRRWYQLRARLRIQRGTITSLDCDHKTEVAVAWDDGSVTGNARGGINCGKKGYYQLVYDS